MSSVSSQKRSKKVYTSIRVDELDLQRIKEYAKRTNSSVSRLVGDLFRALIEEIESEEKDGSENA
jgi:hypothetical protein